MKVIEYAGNEIILQELYLHVLIFLSDPNAHRGGWENIYFLTYNLPPPPPQSFSLEEKMLSSLEIQISVSWNL